MSKFDEDFLVFLPRDAVNHLHMCTNNVPRMLDVLLADFATEHSTYHFRASVLFAVFYKRIVIVKTVWIKNGLISSLGKFSKNMNAYLLC